MIVSAFAGGPAFLHLVLVQERASSLRRSAARAPSMGGARRWCRSRTPTGSSRSTGWACWLVLQLQLCGAIKFLT